MAAHNGINDNKLDCRETLSGRARRRRHDEFEREPHSSPLDCVDKRVTLALTGIRFNNHPN